MIHKLELCKQMLWRIKNGAETPHKQELASAFAKLKDWYMQLQEPLKNDIWEYDELLTSLLTKDKFYQQVFQNE